MKGGAGKEVLAAVDKESAVLAVKQGGVAAPTGMAGRLRRAVKRLFRDVG